MIGKNIAHRHRILAGAFLQPEGSGGGIKGDIHLDGGARIQAERLHARAGNQGEWSSRQSLKRCIGHGGRPRIAGRGSNLKPIRSGRHEGITKTTGRKSVFFPAGIGGGATAGDCGGKGAYPVVAIDRCRLAGGGIHQGDNNTVDRFAGGAVEEDAEGIHHCRADSPIIAVEYIRIGGVDPALHRDGEDSAVRSGNGIRGGVDIADERTGIGAGFSEANDFQVAGCIVNDRYQNGF